MIKVGITHGDINGVGYEIILKTFAEDRMMELCTPVIYGSLKIALAYQKTLGIEPLTFKVVQKPQDAVEGKLNIINCVPAELVATPGESTEEGGLAAFKALEAAVADLKRGAIDTLVTAPINKHNIQCEGFRFPGHTEYLEECFGQNGRHRSLMVLMNEDLRVALVTGHVPVTEIKDSLTQETIVRKLVLFNTSLKQDFGIVRPRIAMLALNPHAGEAGLLGHEEETIIIPAINEAEKEGVMSFGPYAADGFFGSKMYQHFDGVLAMYHDQGLAPFKTLAMDNGVNYTAGLPIVRTSPDHGTAYDIAGRNEASEVSFRHAIYASIDIFRRREIYREMTANPLLKEYVDKGGHDNVKLDDLTKDDLDEL